MNQNEIFTGGEGDAWFRRNREHLAGFRLEADHVHRAISACGLAPRRIIDLGCSLGSRLAALCAHHGAAGVGVEPSAEAVATARAAWPGLAFHRGTLDSHPDLGGPGDLVVVHFVLHWVDRSRLFASLAGIDAAVAPGGHVVIGDFLPDHPVRRAYHHLPGQDVWTWKADYAAMLLATGLYRPVLRQTLGYPSFAAVTAADAARAGIAVLRRLHPGDMPEER